MLLPLLFKKKRYKMGSKNTTFKNRLLKLADHLEKGKLGHKKFDFNVYDIGQRIISKNVIGQKINCGTNGCAIGECPVLFPRQWFFYELNRPMLRSHGSTQQSGEDFFGISQEEYRHLFLPSDKWETTQQPKLFGGRILGPRAKKQSVANNIRAFIKKKEENA